MTNLVILKNEEPMASSITISKELKVTHRAVTELIHKYENDLKDFGVFTVQTEKLNKTGRPSEVIYLNEAQSYLIVSLMRNIGNVSEFKKKLVKEFMKMKKALIDIQVRRNDENWKELRKQVKVSRLETTDTIKRFVKYCTDAGSKKAFTYYGHLTNAEYKALFLLEQKFTNLRDLLTDRQLSMLKTADEIVIIALEHGMAQEMEYHAIYKMAKERLETFASIMPKTPVIMLNECSSTKVTIEKKE